MALKQNVQQQNRTSRLEIATTAQTFRSNPLQFPWLMVELQRRDLDLAKGILALVQTVPEQSGNLMSGIWLTPQRQFYRFEILVSRTPGASDIVEAWEDVTVTTEVNAHQRGTGHTFGWLAIEVLNEMSTAV
jgi:hypothetical protein